MLSKEPIQVSVFFLQLRLMSLSDILLTQKKYWERTFRHRYMPYGGCFMVRLEDNLQLELEAVAFESLWPENFVQSDFYE